MIGFSENRSLLMINLVKTCQISKKGLEMVGDGRIMIGVLRQQ